MQDDLTEATSTPTEDTSVRADLEAAFDSWTDSDAPATDVAAPEPTDSRARDERGRFRKAAETAPEATEEDVRAQWEREEEPKAEPAPDKPATEEQPPQEEPEPLAAEAEGAPPPGWSIKSKSEWEQLPSHIRADIIKREQEVNNGFAKLRDYKGIDQYAEMAKNSGTTLEAALKNYVGFENLLNQDPMRGLLAIAQNAGISRQQLQQMFGGAAPASQPHQNGQTNGAAPAGQDEYDDPYVRDAVNRALQSALNPLTQKLSTLESTFQSRQEADQERQISQAQKVIDELKSSVEYRYFSDVEETINRLFTTGVIERTGDFRTDLAKAYEQACYLHPEVREALINDRLRKTNEESKTQADRLAEEKRAKSEAAKRASVSVRGAPSGQVSAPVNSKGTVRDDLLAAWDAHS
jgi:hypothetical protein